MSCAYFFFFNDTATTEIYTLSLHDALPISATTPRAAAVPRRERPTRTRATARPASADAPSTPRRSSAARDAPGSRSEEHTSELQSPCNLVCRLLLEKKKTLRSNVWRAQSRI